jgi:hypothetical protein
LINSRKKKRFKLLRQSLRRRSLNVIQKKKMKNEEWHFTFRKKILYSRESFTKRIAQTKSRRLSCKTFRVWENFWATSKKILMIEHVDKR